MIRMLPLVVALVLALAGCFKKSELKPELHVIASQPSSAQPFGLQESERRCVANSDKECDTRPLNSICGIYFDQRCEFGAVDQDFNPICRCRGCQTCPGSCPIEDPNLIQRWIDELADPVFRKREAAQAALVTQCGMTCEGRAIIDRLSAELASNPSAEARARITSIFGVCKGGASNWCESHGGVRKSGIECEDATATALPPGPASPTASSFPDGSPHVTSTPDATVSTPSAPPTPMPSIGGN